MSRGALVIGCFLILIGGEVALAAETISGTVRAAATGLGLVGIDLDVFDDTGAAVTVTGGSTGTGGVYIVTLPGPGTYTIRADASAPDGVADQYYSGVFLRSQATPIVVGPSQARTGIDFSLVAGVTVSGAVTGSGLPLADVDIDVFAANGEFLGSYPARTQVDGTYLVGALPPGDYLVRADPDPSLGQLFVRRFFGGSINISTAAPIAVGASPVSGIDLSLTPGGTIRGVVTDQSSGLPLADLDLDVFDSSGSRLSIDADTGIDGSYEIGPLPSGAYLFRVDPSVAQGYARTYYLDAISEADAVPVGVVAGKRKRGVDLAILPGGTLSGVVREAATSLPLEGIDLDLFDGAGRFMAAYTATSDAGGQFQLGPLRAGTYFVRADPSPAQGFARQLYDGQIDVNFANPVSVSNGSDTAGVDFLLLTAGSITGTVRDQGLQPLAGVDLDLFDGNGVRLRQGATSAPDGTYTLESLNPGTYLLRVDPTAAQGFAREYYDARPARSLADAVAVVAASTTSPIDFSLPAAGRVSGRVADAQGISIPHVDIDVLRIEGASFVPMDQGAHTDSVGSYLVTSLPPGTYVLGAEPDPLVSPRIFHGQATDPNDATPISVSSSQTVGGIDVTITALVGQPQTAGQQSCINALNTDLRRVAKAFGRRQVFRCINRKARGLLRGSIEKCMVRRPPLRVRRALRRTVAHESLLCGVTPPDFAATDAATVNDAALKGEPALVHDVFGSNLDAAIFRKAGPTLLTSRCQLVAVKRTQDCEYARLEEYNVCKGSRLASGAAVRVGNLEPCLDADPLQNVFDACDPDLGAIREAVGTICKGVPLAAAFPVCGAATEEAVAGCLAAVSACRACLDLDQADAMSRDCDLYDDGATNRSCP